jgi:hypothetical protein
MYEKFVSLLKSHMSRGMEKFWVLIVTGFFFSKVAEQAKSKSFALNGQTSHFESGAKKEYFLPTPTPASSAIRQPV